MEAKGLMLTCAPPLPPSPTFARRRINLIPHHQLASDLTLMKPKSSCRSRT
ncbi:hypothetical protein MKW94_022585, partial [Papaver nudicaule]|nr:hypothetical protein [Papaver nudicaule]